MARTGGVLALLLLGLTVSGLQAQMQSGGAGTNPPAAEMPMGQMAGRTMPAQAAGPLKISFGEKSAEWTPEQLAVLPHTSVQVYNSHSKANETYAGVPLIDLLTKVGVPETPEGKDQRLYLIVAGSDGYEVVYSIGEVTPKTHDAVVIVADSKDGRPLGSNGPFMIVATRDLSPSRWVRNLVVIRVMTAE